MHADAISSGSWQATHDNRKGSESGIVTVCDSARLRNSKSFSSVSMLFIAGQGQAIITNHHCEHAISKGKSVMRTAAKDSRHLLAATGQCS